MSGISLINSSSYYSNYYTNQNIQGTNQGEDKEKILKTPAQIEKEENRFKTPAQIEKEEKEHMTVAEKRANCETCKNRKYVDGSNENNVSFKAPGHISPAASFGKVLSHEHEHVANAVAKGNQQDNELVSVSVSVKMEVCPECGRVYAAGGCTHTVMKTTTGGNNTPYDNNRRIQEYANNIGANFDVAL